MRDVAMARLSSISLTLVWQRIFCCCTDGLGPADRFDEDVRTCCWNAYALNNRGKVKNGWSPLYFGISCRRTTQSTFISLVLHHQSALAGLPRTCESNWFPWLPRPLLSGAGYCLPSCVLCLPFPLSHSLAALSTNVLQDAVANLGSVGLVQNVSYTRKITFACC